MLDYSDLIKTCDKKLFICEFHDEDSIEYIDVIDDLWHQAHTRLEQHLPVDLSLVERIIQHNQLDQHLHHLGYSYCLAEQMDSWSHSEYLTEEKMSQHDYEIIMQQVKEDVRHGNKLITFTRSVKWNQIDNQERTI
jgi:hypothetical protein